MFGCDSHLHTLTVNQGMALAFVREDRIAKVITTIEQLKNCVKDLWHSTHSANLGDILREGLKPGGKGGDRSSCYFSPMAPWEEGFAETSRAKANTFIQIDPVKLMESVPNGSVV